MRKLAGLVLILAFIVTVLSSGLQFASAQSTVLIVTCASPVVAGESTYCVGTLATDGTHSVAGETLSWMASGSGSFVSSTCTLVVPANACTVKYTPSTTVGSPQTITASYAGDGYNEAATGHTSLTVEAGCYNGEPLCFQLGGLCPAGNPNCSEGTLVHTGIGWPQSVSTMTVTDSFGSSGISLLPFTEVVETMCFGFNAGAPYVTSVSGSLNGSFIDYYSAYWTPPDTIASTLQTMSFSLWYQTFKHGTSASSDAITVNLNGTTPGSVAGVSQGGCNAVEGVVGGSQGSVAIPVAAGTTTAQVPTPLSESTVTLPSLPFNTTKPGLMLQAGFSTGEFFSIAALPGLAPPSSQAYYTEGGSELSGSNAMYQGSIWDANEEDPFYLPEANNYYSNLYSASGFSGSYPFTASAITSSSPGWQGYIVPAVFSVQNVTIPVTVTITSSSTSVITHRSTTYATTTTSTQTVASSTTSVYVASTQTATSFSGSTTSTSATNTTTTLTSNSTYTSSLTATAFVVISSTTTAVILVHKVDACDWFSFWCWWFPGTMVIFLDAIFIAVAFTGKASTKGTTYMMAAGLLNASMLTYLMGVLPGTIVVMTVALFSIYATRAWRLIF